MLFAEMHLEEEINKNHETSDYPLLSRNKKLNQCLNEVKNMKFTNMTSNASLMLRTNILASMIILSKNSK
jgi:hypothetical protein